MGAEESPGQPGQSPHQAGVTGRHVGQQLAADRKAQGGNEGSRNGGGQPPAHEKVQARSSPKDVSDKEAVEKTLAYMSQMPAWREHPRLQKK